MNINLRELTQIEAETFLHLKFAKDVDKLFTTVIDSHIGGWVLKAIEKRFEAHQINADKKLMIFILSMGEGVVGKCAKYVDYIANIAIAKKYTDVSFQLFAKEICPHGVPDFNYEK